jgi:FRG domain-containing protein
MPIKRTLSTRSTTSNLRDRMRQYKCSSLDQFLHQVATEMTQVPVGNDGSVVLWRGQGDVNWSLAPSLQRRWLDNPNGLKDAERKMFEEFKIAAPYLLPSNSTNDWDRLSIAQHYGMPTRLLDWTVNHMVALWFALASASDGDAAVWSFRPSQSSLADPASLTTSPFSIETTTVFRPSVHSPRVAMQAGWHTAHEFEPATGLVAIDHVPKLTRRIALFQIPKENRKELQQQLERCGISVTTVYGDLASLCGDIANRYRR